MRLHSMLVASLGAALFAGTAIGCSSDGASGGTVTGQTQNQGVRADGTAVQERTRTRQTGSGATVQETETRERRVVKPAPGSTTSDPTQADPAK